MLHVPLCLRVNPLSPDWKPSFGAANVFATCSDCGAATHVPRVCTLLPQRRSTALATNADAALLLECECAWSVREVCVCEIE